MGKQELTLITIIMKKFLKIFKEQIWIVPLIFVGFYQFNAHLLKVDPTGGYFIADSQMENLAWWAVKIMFWACVGFLVFWVGFRPMYNHYHDKFYLNFDTLTDKLKDTITIIILIVVFTCVAILSSKGVENPQRTKIRALMDSQLYIRETTENRGPEVDAFLLHVGVRPPAEWCAAYASYDLDYVGAKSPHSAWSPNFALPKDIIWMAKHKNNMEPLTGDVFTIYYPALGRVAHTGLHYSTDKNGYDINQAGNTSGDGKSRRGDRVGRRKMDRDKIYAYSRYIK